MSTKGVAYINIDVSVAGTNMLIVRGSPLMKTRVMEIVKNVEDPHVRNDSKQQTVYERLVEVIKPSDGEIPFDSLGSGSDYASFYQFVGEKVSSIVSLQKNSFTTDFFKENKKCMALYCLVNRSVPKKVT